MKCILLVAGHTTRLEAEIAAAARTSDEFASMLSLFGGVLLCEVVRAVHISGGSGCLLEWRCSAVMFPDDARLGDWRGRGGTCNS